MKLIAHVMPSKPDGLYPPMKTFHVRLPKGKRYFGHENIVTRHIGPRPWSEMFWVDKEDMVNLVYAK